MQLQQKTMSAIVLSVLTISASADPLVYLASADPVTGVGLFGTLDLTTGAYQQRGPIEPDGYFGLAAGPNGSLLSLTYTGGLDSINPATGVFSRIGPTGLSSCGFVGDPGCGPTSAFSLGGFNGIIYATDFKNSIYVINPSTATATLLALHSGIPPTPFILGTQTRTVPSTSQMKQSGALQESSTQPMMLSPSTPSLIRPRVL
jgi:hypothetical protein